LSPILQKSHAHNLQKLKNISNMIYLLLQRVAFVEKEQFMIWSLQILLHIRHPWYSIYKMERALIVTTHFTHKNPLMSICQTLVIIIITTTGISRVYLFLSLSFPYLGRGLVNWGFRGRSIWIERYVIDQSIILNNKVRSSVVGLFELSVMWSINPSSLITKFVHHWQSKT
jgi:hypothetical protein